MQCIGSLNTKKKGRSPSHSDFGLEPKWLTFVYASRFVRVLLAQGPLGGLGVLEAILENKNRYYT